MVRSEMGPWAGGIALFGVLLIMIILLAVLALVVVRALAGSPWGAFTVFCTVPIALLMGIYSRFVRVGRIGEMSAIGVVLLLIALIYGRSVTESPQLAAFFDLRPETLALMIISYGFVASVLPVWLLLAPRVPIPRLVPSRLATGPSREQPMPSVLSIKEWAIRAAPVSWSAFPTIRHTSCTAAPAIPTNAL
jgi:carbon starvation protein CstA